MISFKEFIGTTALVSTIGQFFSGVFTVRKVQLQGNPGDISHIPFLASVVSCLLWLVYGSYIDDFSVICTNMVGVSLNSFYVLVFFYFSIEKMKIIRHVALCFITIMVFLQYLKTIENPMTASSHLGIACIFVTLSCCASPLLSFKHVVASKSTESLPFPLILCMFIVSFQWWIYSILIDDLYMKITNFFATMIAGGQLLLFIIYPSSCSTNFSSTRKI